MCTFRNLAVIDSGSSNPHAYEIPITIEKQQKQKPEVIYSVVNLANQTKGNDKKDSNDGAPSTGKKK